MPVGTYACNIWLAETRAGIYPLIFLCMLFVKIQGYHRKSDFVIIATNKKRSDVNM
jgi:hypothetical protein